MKLQAADAKTNAGSAFVTTQWSMVLAVQGASPAAEAALEEICRRYCWGAHASRVRLR